MAEELHIREKICVGIMQKIAMNNLRKCSVYQTLCLA